MSISVTLPTAEPLDLAEAKAHLRVTFSADDLMIGSWIAAARDYAQNLTRKQMVMSRWKQTLDGFPSGDPILLDKGPVAQVVSIQYIDQAGVTQTVSPSTYIVDTATDPVRITPVFGQIWPIPILQMASAWVTFDAGYATPFTATGNTITPSGGPAYVIGQAVRFSNSGGALPTPLKALTDYYIITAAAGVYTVSLTSGGGVVPLTDTGTGTSFLSNVPYGLQAWMKIRLASMYENREELGMAAMIQPLPYADRLLDGYKTYQF